jgi:TetR/AcrR family transcriptional regulator
VLYYFKSKDQIYQSLLERTLDGWLDPFLAIDPNGDPIEELTKYINAKMDMSFDNPLDSRLFAMEVLNGAPKLQDSMRNMLKVLVDEKAQVISAWMKQGKLKPVDPYHLIFSIWSVTQHYADFGVQIEILLGGQPDRETSKAAVLEILMRGLR